MEIKELGELILDVRMEGYAEPAGKLVSNELGATRFFYNENYLTHVNAIPISMSLPISDDVYDDTKTRAFFDNLLPENNQLQQVMDREGIERDNIVALLFFLGADCPGAISCIAPDSPPIKIPGNLSTDYTPLDDSKIEEIVQTLADRLPLPSNIRDPSPVAGVQSKIALTLLNDGTFALPKTDFRVPTTHILKVPRRGNTREAKLEFAAAELANACGFDVAIPAVLTFGDVDALLIKRFDRSVNSAGIVSRIHLEDFAQALGLPASLKYERYGQKNKIFNAESIVKILNKTNEPALARRDFILATFFNISIGNSDNHAKNHSLIYDQGPVPRLAPLYDLVPTLLDPQFTHDFSFTIGKAKNTMELSKEDLASFMKTFGFSQIATRRFFDELLKKQLEVLDAASEKLVEFSLKDFDDLIGAEIKKIIIATELQMGIRERDLYLQGVGGWGTMS